MRPASSLLVAAIAGSFAVGLTPRVGDAQEPIVIGFSAPLSGDYAEYGSNFQKAITLHVDEINAAGGVDGRMIEVIESDDRSDSREASAVAQRYVDNDDILAAMASFASTPSMAAAPIYQRAGLVQLCPSCSHPDYTGIGEYMFRNTTTQEIEAPLLAEFTVNFLGAETIAVVYRQDDWGLSASGNFIARAEELGAEILLNEAFLETERDFRPLITELASLQPDVLHIAMFYTEAAVLAQQLKSAGLEIPVVTTTSMFNPQFITLGEDAVEGYIIPATFFPGNPAPHVQAFVASYEDRWEGTPDSFAAIAYDSIGILASAMQYVLDDGGDLTREAIKDAMFAMPAYEGVSGVAAFNEQGDVVKEITWLTIVDGEFVTYQADQ